jgi:hypothetical protein
VSAEIVHVTARKYRGTIPDAHRVSLDTRIQWLWNQRFGTVQTVWMTSRSNGEVLDHTAATLILQAIMGKDLESIVQVFQRLEGGPLEDEEVLDREGEQQSMRI